MRAEEVSASRSEGMAGLFDTHYVDLCKFAALILGDRASAEEAVMDAFTKVFSRWRSISRLDSPGGYLRKVVLNICRSRLRRRKVEQAFLSQRPGQVVTLDHDERLDLWGAIQNLPDRQRICIILRYYEDASEAHIAELLDCSVGTVKSQLHKA